MAYLCKVKRYSFDEYEYEMICTVLNEKIHQCVQEKNETAEMNYRQLLGDLQEEPWQEIGF